MCFSLLYFCMCFLPTPQSNLLPLMGIWSVAAGIKRESGLQLSIAKIGLFKSKVKQYS